MKKDISSRKDIEILINEFYKQLIEDDLVGVFFTEVVKLNWEAHIPTMYNFWESILLGGANYKGNPMLKHIKLHQKKELKAEHFERWLTVWGNTIRTNFAGSKSEEAITRAQNIASLMLHKVKQAEKY